MGGRVSWDWHEGRLVVTPPEGQAAIYELRPDRTIEEVEDFQARFDESLGVHQMLQNAHSAFGKGWADYTDAAENIRSLKRELPKAAGWVQAAGEHVGQFFSPPGLSESFGRDTERLAAFVIELLPRLAPEAPTEPAAAAIEPPKRRKGKA